MLGAILFILLLIGICNPETRSARQIEEDEIRAKEYKKLTKKRDIPSANNVASLSYKHQQRNQRLITDQIINAAQNGKCHVEISKNLFTEYCNEQAVINSFIANGYCISKGSVYYTVSWGNEKRKSFFKNDYQYDLFYRNYKKDHIVCCSCGSSVSSTNKYCIRCGQKIER